MISFISRQNIRYMYAGKLRRGPYASPTPLETKLFGHFLRVIRISRLILCLFIIKIDAQLQEIILPIVCVQNSCNMQSGYLRRAPDATPTPQKLNFSLIFSACFVFFSSSLAVLLSNYISNYINYRQLSYLSYQSIILALC